ncbi:hypothetical protein PIB30_099538, partial [Stylosanthes scabra]|nr:hypothetical protein [Stylosanthes scabra]
KEGEEKSVAESPRETRNVGVVAGTGVDSGRGDTTEGEKAGFESEGLMEGEPSREIESGGCCCRVPMGRGLQSPPPPPFIHGDPSPSPRGLSGSPRSPPSRIKSAGTRGGGGNCHP